MIYRGPTALRSLRRFNRTIQISLGAKTHLILNHAIVRIENVADTASAADGVACDEMFDVTHRSSFNCKFGTSIQAMTAALQCFVFAGWDRAEDHTSELQSLMRLAYAVSGLT